MTQANIGVVGLATMGANLARNIARNGFNVSVYNRTFSKTEELIKLWEQDKIKFPSSGEMLGYADLVKFIESLERPRKVILLVKSGTPVDVFIQKLYPLLDAGDIIIDTGNSNWKDTDKRQKQLENGSMFTLETLMNDEGLLEDKKVHFIGSGVSGGEEGALWGPSLMPGGRKEAVEEILPIFSKIAAKDFDGKPCVTYVGQDAAGHFVKMVHNGIEYAIMQAIAEVYDILRSSGYSAKEASEVFSKLNSGVLESFLLEITVKTLATIDEGTKKPLVDLIKDEAKAKGTGAWTVEAALEFGTYAPMIAASVFARTGSSRNWVYEVKKTDYIVSKKEVDFVKLQKTMEAVYTLSYLQGLDIIHKANQEKSWEIDIQEVIRIWQGGCIIRSKMLLDLPKTFKSVLDLEEYKEALQLVVGTEKLPLPVLRSALDMALTLSAERLPTNLTQAQRDYFGAHTYQRTDKEGDFSGGWGE